MAGLTRGELLKRRRVRTHSPAAELSVPRELRAVSITPAGVQIAWHRANDHGPRVRYEVLRDGRRVASVRAPRFEDGHVRTGRTYGYVVRAIDGQRTSRRSRVLWVTVPTPLPAPTPPPAPVVAPAPPPPPALTQAMVDRLFWRAGFGPSADERAQWTGQPVADLVDFLVSAPNTLLPATNPPTYNGNPIDPLDSDDELQMEWLDVMTRSTNPLVERLTFFCTATSRSARTPASIRRRFWPTATACAATRTSRPLRPRASPTWRSR